MVGEQFAFQAGKYYNYRVPLDYLNPKLKCNLQFASKVWNYEKSGSYRPYSSTERAAVF
jgi:hypothetical protein